MKQFFFASLLLGLAAGCQQQASQQAATLATTPAAPVAVATPSAAPEAINTPAALQLLSQPGTVVLDVRTPVEYTVGHLPQARNFNVNADDFAQQVATLDTGKTYVLYCHSGKRSSKAAAIMRQQGFYHLVNGGGYDDLKK